MGYSLDHRSFQVRHANGTIVTAVENLLSGAAQPTLQTEGIEVESISGDGVCLGARCVSWTAAYQHCRKTAGWVMALPAAVSVADRSECGMRSSQPGESGRPHCYPESSCGRCSDYDPATIGPTFDLRLAWHPGTPALTTAANVRRLGFKNLTMHGRVGFVPTLTQSIYAQGAYRSGPRSRAPLQLARQLPCSSARFEDGVILHTFFTRSDGTPIHDGRFLEMGAFNGDSESTTWYLEGCLGWRGVLVEAMPRLFAHVIQQPRATLNLRLAVCEEHGWANFTNFNGESPIFSKRVLDLRLRTQEVSRPHQPDVDALARRRAMRTTR